MSPLFPKFSFVYINKAGVHFRAKRAKDFFPTVFAWRKDYVIKTFRRNKKKVEGSSTFFQPLRQIWPMKCFFFRLTNRKVEDYHPKFLTALAVITILKPGSCSPNFISMWPFIGGKIENHTLDFNLKFNKLKCFHFWIIFTKL